MQNFFLLALLVYATTAKAQTSDSAAGKLNVFSSLGLSSMDNGYKPTTGNSVQTTTGVEWRLARPSSIGLALSFDSYQYQKTGTYFALDGSLRATALALFYRHRFGKGNWQPYLKAGGGTAWLNFPTVELVRNVSHIDRKVENVAVGMAEAGLQIRVHSRYSLLVGAEKKWMAKASHLDNESLSATGFKVGIISAF